MQAGCGVAVVRSGTALGRQLAKVNAWLSNHL